MTTLFGEDVDTVSVAPKRRLHLGEEHVRELLGRPEAAFISWERLDDQGFPGYKIGVGDVPLLKAGKRKGERNYRAATNRQYVYVKHEEHAAWVVAWSKRTGLCAPCVGTGEEWMGWSVTDGTRMETCRSCGGTGRA